MKIRMIIMNLDCKKVFITISYLFLLMFLLLCDDYIFRIFRPIPKFSEIRGMDIRTIIILLAGITSFITFTKKKLPIYILLGFFAIISIIQLNYIAYFGEPIPPSLLPKLITEISEVTQSGFGEFGRVYFAFLSTIIPYTIITLIVRKYNDYFYS